MYNFNYFFSNKVQGEDTHKDTFLEKERYRSKTGKLSWDDFQGQAPNSSITTYGTRCKYSF